MEDSKLTSEDKVRIVSVTLMAVDIIVMLVLTGMSVLILEFSRACRATGAEIPRALSFLGLIVPGKYFIFVSIIAVVLVLKEYYIPNKWVRLILNVLVANCAVMYFLVCVIAIVAPIEVIINMLKEM